MRFHHVTRLVCAIALSLLPSSLLAQVPTASSGQADRSAPVMSTSQRVWVTTTDGQERQGTLVSFSSTRLVMRVLKADVTIARADVARVEIAASPVVAMNRGAAIGALAGGALALAECASCRPGGFKAYITMLGVAEGAVMGSGLGAVCGQRSGGRQILYVGVSERAPGHAGQRNGRESTVRVTAMDGRAREGSLVSFSSSGLELRSDEEVWRVPFADVRTIEVPRAIGPAMWKGAVVFAASLGAPVFLYHDMARCQTTGHSTFCSPSLPLTEQSSLSTPFKIYITLFGAALGTGAGALTARWSHKRDVVYASGTSMGATSAWSVTPTFAHGHVGVAASVTWQW